MPNSTVTLDFTGVKQLQDVLKKLGAHATQAAKAALYQEAERIMTVSKQTYVPIDFGNLRDTGIVGQPEERGSHIVVELGYGGPSASYAIHVHENLEAQHRPPTQAKYLELPSESDL